MGNWGAVERLFGDLYIDELYWLARDVVEGCDEVFRLTDGRVSATYRLGEHRIWADHAVHRVIDRLLAAAARIPLLIAHRSIMGGKLRQTEEEYDLQERRISWLASLLDGIQLDEVTNRKVRNSLEHFDEYLDRVARRLIAGEDRTPALVPMNMIFSDREAVEGLKIAGTKPNVAFLRVYLRDERMVINAGQEIRLGVLRSDCVAIRDRLEPRIGRQDETGPLTGMVVVPAQTVA